MIGGDVGLADVIVVVYLIGATVNTIACLAIAITTIDNRDWGFPVTTLHEMGPIIMIPILVLWPLVDIAAIFFGLYKLFALLNLRKIFFVPVDGSSE